MIVASTTARVNETTVTAVRTRLRPRLAQAIPGRDAPESVPRLRPPDRAGLPSLQRTASTGETFAALRPGRAQERNTVPRAKRAEPAKIHGLKDVAAHIVFSSRTDRTTGVSLTPTRKPSASPMGMPMRLRIRACWRMMRLICRPVVPMVFRRP